MASQINLMLTCAVGIIYLIFVMTLPAYSVEKPTVYIITPAPSCLNYNGERVVFKNVENAQGDSAAGMAKRDEERNPVVYRFNYKNSPKPLQHFIVFTNVRITKQVTLIYASTRNRLST